MKYSRIPYVTPDTDTQAQTRTLLSIPTIKRSKPNTKHEQPLTNTEHWRGGWERIEEEEILDEVR
jgi:hypothetical protein